MSEWVYGSSGARSVGVSMGAVWVASVNNKIHVARGPVTGKYAICLFLGFTLLKCIFVSVHKIPGAF